MKSIRDQGRPPFGAAGLVLGLDFALLAVVLVANADVMIQDATGGES